MATCVVYDAQGGGRFNIAAGADPTTCSTVVYTRAEINAFPTGQLEFAALGIDALTISAAFGFGFSAVILLWYAGYIVKVATQAIGKV